MPLLIDLLNYYIMLLHSVDYTVHICTTPRHVHIHVCVYILHMYMYHVYMYVYMYMYIHNTHVLRVNSRHFTHTDTLFHYHTSHGH